MVQWDKDSCSDGGFLKIDILGLGMLSAVERCVELIAKRTGEQVDLSRIPFDDPATFKAIQEADTTGVFQIESRAQMGSLRRTRPATLADLMIQVALVRPGPIVGGAVNTYIERRMALLLNPEYEIPFLHPSLRECLSETLGTIVFQDQVIEVSQAFAGFSPGQAESLRRAMSRKRSTEAMNSHREEFLSGAAATHPDASPEVIARVWNMVAGFAGFGFPKSHAAAFGLLAYQSTWLRVHHPAEFLCALLCEQPMGFYPPDALIHEAQHHEVIILPPDVLPQRSRMHPHPSRRNPDRPELHQGHPHRRHRKTHRITRNRRTLPDPRGLRRPCRGHHPHPRTPRLVRRLRRTRRQRSPRPAHRPLAARRRTTSPQNQGRATTRAGATPP